MKIALAQINPTVGDFSGNLTRMERFLGLAAEVHADLVLFPELALCGYPPADFLEKDAFLDQAQKSLDAMAALTAKSSSPAVLCGTALRSDRAAGKRARNVAALLENGKISFLQQKMLLPFYDVFDEQRYFEPAMSQTMTSVKGQPLAITICEDAWNDKGFWPQQLYTVDPVEKLMQHWSGRAPKIILNISASPYWLGKQHLRRQMLAALAKRHGAIVAMVNQVGGNDSLVFDGSSLVLNQAGELMAQGAAFVEDLVIFDTELQIPLKSDQLPKTAGHGAGVCEVEDEIANVWQALVLGTRDYVSKCGFRKALVGLSGGIDSALVAAIAVEALGVDNVMGVGMPSEYSSSGSVDDARQLATNLGIQFELLSIHGPYEQYLRALDPLFAGTPFGLAEENLQSRIRGGLLMALSNKFGALVLTTGNKSEMATGYCTLYGDMVGALAVIGDVFKTRVYALSRYANREREIIPEATLTKPPSAELRPDQKDTDSLPPYDVLDPILEAYVERYCSADEIAVEQDVDVAMVRGILRLVERSEYKRQQAAPVLKITKKSFGMGRRFPIAVQVQV